MRQDNQELIKQYQEAYRKANNNEAPRITYNKGWFTIHSFSVINTKHRRSEIEEMIETLKTRIR